MWLMSMLQRSLLVMPILCLLALLAVGRKRGEKFIHRRSAETDTDTYLLLAVQCIDLFATYMGRRSLVQLQKGKRKEQGTNDSNS